MRKPKAITWLQKREMFRISLVFLLCIAAIFLLLRFKFIYLATVEPFTAFIALISSGIFKLLGTPIRAEGTALLWMEGTKHLFSIDIKNGCNGLYPSAIFLSAVLAQPSPWRKRLLGFLIGLPAIFAVNLIRVITLFYLGYYFKSVLHRDDLLDVVHIYVWQSLIIIFAVLIWLFWVDRIVKPQKVQGLW